MTRTSIILRNLPSFSIHAQCLIVMVGLHVKHEKNEPSDIHPSLCWISNRVTTRLRSIKLKCIWFGKSTDSQVSIYALWLIIKSKLFAPGLSDIRAAVKSHLKIFSQDDWGTESLNGWKKSGKQRQKMRTTTSMNTTEKQQQRLWQLRCIRMEW